MSKYGRYWEMRTPNPFASASHEEIFKCVTCGAESFPEKGFDGEPAPQKCGHD